jgi:phosphatidylglycerophosphatase C
VTRRTVAAFDFDGTLTRRDTLLPFLASVSGWPAVAGALARASAGGIERDALKERVLTRVLGGRPHGEVLAAGRRYGTTLARSGVTPAMRERLAWHRGEGHEIVIVSASLDVYLDEVGAALGVTVLSTRLEIDADARCTGRLDGGNCRGIEKADRLRAHLGGDEVTLWAYGDSAGDREMLAMADHAVRVRAGRIRDHGG